MTLKTLTAAAASALDQELMGPGQFSIDQLMELAGLAVSQAVYKTYPPTTHSDILILIGPGNNGGDGLVAARHLAFYGYKPTIYYPKCPSNPLYTRLLHQLTPHSIPLLTTLPSSSADPSDSSSFSLILDALFGFSFNPPLRPQFTTVIQFLEATKTPTISVDIPSSWTVDNGPAAPGEVGASFMPSVLVSLTAPKPLIKHFTGRHFIGGRFMPEEIAQKYGVSVPPFKDMEQVVEVDENGNRKE